MLSRSVRYPLQVILLAAAYLAAAWIGLAFAIPPGNATAVWPASGIALAAMLLLGMRVWPGVWLGALLANSLLTAVSPATAAAIATGNTCEALLAAWLCRRLLPQTETPFQHVEEAFLFAVAAGVASTVAATAGAASMVLGGDAAWPQFLANWGTWWLGDVASLMIVVPLVLAYAKPSRRAWSGSRWAELAILFALTVLASQAIFGGWLSEQVAHHLLYIPLIFLVWVCLRFELAEVTLATALLAGAAIGGTWAGLGPFRTEAVQQSLFDLQMFMNLYALTGLAVAAVVARRRISEQHLQQSHQELEQIVRDRTQALTAANAGLRQEMAERQRAEESLRERELRYQELIEQLHVGVVVHAPDTSILLANKRAAELLDVTASQMPGKTDNDPAWSFVREDGTPLPTNEYPVNRVLATRQPLQDFVCGINRPGVGDRRWVLVNALPEFTGEHELARVVVTFMDITERRQLQELERLRLDAALDSIGDSVLITGADGLIQYVNPAFERITGYSRAQVLGHNPRLLQSGQHDQAFYRRMWQTLADGETWHGEFVDKNRDGGLYDTEATISQIRDAAGHAIGYVGVQRDVSDRKRAERGLAESEARIRAIVETAADGIITIDERGLIETGNPAVEEMFGYAWEEMIGRNVSLLMPSPEREEHDDHLARYAQTRRPNIIGIGREVRGRRKDGTIFPVDLSVSETRLGDRCFFTGIVRDATLRHLRLRAEKALAATHEQFRLARSIQQSFFPSAPPVVAGYDLGGASYPADETGGDYFDYFPMPAGRVGVVLADVSGHGVGPALVMSQTRAYLHALLPLDLDVSQLATRLNEFLITDGPDARFVTLFLAQLDPRDDSFVYASAGHQCFLLGPGDEVQPLDSTYMPLGVLPGRVPSARPRTLQPGQVVLFLTDGVAETTSPQGVAFGIERTLDVLRANRHRPAGEIVETLYRSARNFAEGTPQQDDITAVVLKVQAQPRAAGLEGTGI
jgi:sigma-B regulation protein RsbU (phosphoserine phosphatase)